jgi:hypothetical protein
VTRAAWRSVGAIVAVFVSLGLLAPVVGATGSETIVLGARAFAPMGVGFGTARPRTIFNGGDPSGLVEHLTWSHWGSRTATAVGETAIFKPQGGYYPGLVRAELRASRPGHCHARGPLAYTRLEAREPSHPGGRLGKWFLWSDEKSVCAHP